MSGVPSPGLPVTVKFVPSTAVPRVKSTNTVESTPNGAQGWFFKEYALLRAYNRTEAKPEIEMLFWGRYGADLNRMLERRVPELITGHGPWVV